MYMNLFSSANYMFFRFMFTTFCSSFHINSILGSLIESKVLSGINCLSVRIERVQYNWNIKCFKMLCIQGIVIDKSGFQDHLSFANKLGSYFVAIHGKGVGGKKK